MTGRETARSVALGALLACERQGAWSDGALKKAVRAAGLDRRDAALATRLCFGVMQNRMRLDYYLNLLSKTPVDRLEGAVRGSLRLGLYQLMELDRVPDSAAVNESVALVRAHSRNPRAAGMVNAILRNFLRRREELPPPADPAVRYSHPAWLVEAFSRELGGEGVEALLSADNGEPPTCAQVNTVKGETSAVRTALEAEGVKAAPHPWLPGCLLLENTGNLEDLPAFREGLFYIQDAAARLAVLAAGPEPGWQVLDACAAPGGKSFAAALAMENRGRVLSCDIHPHKEALIQAGAARLGLSCIQTQVLDGKAFQAEYRERFDLVMADVPCSGLGIIRKKPDIRYKDPEPLAGLPRVQSAILDNVARYVKPGGVLLYATCTLLRRENGDVVRSFLAQHGEFSLEGFTLPGSIGRVEEGMLTLWPHLHGTDGFFFAKLRRSARGDL